MAGFARNPVKHSAPLRGLTALAALALSASTALATPVVNSVVTGANAPTTVGNLTTVNQTAQKSIINWNSLNTSSAETLRFNMPNSGAISLNRVVSGVPTDFRGKLESRVAGQVREGQVWIINQAGVVFNNGARVDVGGLLVSTADITDANFLNPATPNTYSFDQPGLATATITVRDARITGKDAKDVSLAANRGYIAMFAPQINITDDSRLKTNVGDIALGAGNRQYEVTLNPGGDELIGFSVSDPATAASLASAISVSNNSLIDVSGPDVALGTRKGTITLTANDVNGVYDTLINLDSSKLNSSTNGGSIVITATGHSSDALININNTFLQATGKGQPGGQITLTAVNNDNVGTRPGNLIRIQNQSKLHVNGDTAGTITLNAQGYSTDELILITGQNQLHATGLTAPGLIQVDANGFTDGGTAPLLRISDQNSIQTFVDVTQVGGAINLNARRNGVFSNADIDINGYQLYDQNDVGQNNVIYPCPTINGVGCGSGNPGGGGTGGTGGGTGGAGFTAFNLAEIFEQETPLERYLMSERDENLASERGLIYQRPFEVTDAVSNLNLRLTSSGGAAPVNTGAAPSPTALGALAPAAGGEASAQELGELSPAAGGNAPIGGAAACANAYLDTEWNVPQAQRNCVAETQAEL